jgi:hypothetical protein
LKISKWVWKVAASSILLAFYGWHPYLIPGSGAPGAVYALLLHSCQAFMTPGSNVEGLQTYFHVQQTEQHIERKQTLQHFKYVMKIGII